MEDKHCQGKVNLNLVVQNYVLFLLNIYCTWTREAYRIFKFQLTTQITTVALQMHDYRLPELVYPCEQRPP